MDKNGRLSFFLFCVLSHLTYSFRGSSYFKRQTLSSGDINSLNLSFSILVLNNSNIAMQPDHFHKTNLFNSTILDL